jgi:phosphate transport system permease protein
LADSFLHAGVHDQWNTMTPDTALEASRHLAGSPPDIANSPGELEAQAWRRDAIRAAARRSLARRKLTGRAAHGVCMTCVVLAFAPLVALVGYTTERGIPALSLGFLVHDPTPPGIPGGGIAPAIVGTLTIVGVALAMAVPVGLLVAVFLFDRRGPLAGAIRFGADVMTGIPSIAIGIFSFAVLVRPLHHASNLAGSFALAVLMLPIMIRADEEAMRTVPMELSEAGLALGARRWRVVGSVVLRGSLPGLVAGNLLAVARAAGETAPLLFVLASSNALPLTIFEDGTQAFGDAQQTAWGTALVLLLFVLALSTVARVAAYRLTRKAVLR